MNKLFRIAVAGLATAGLAGVASAYTLTPKSMYFGALGPMVVGNAQQSHLWCQVRLNGHTTETGEARITSALIGGQTGCSQISMTGLLYRVMANGAGAARMTHVGLAGPFVGSCGPGPVTVYISKSGGWIFNVALPGGCTINATLTTSPAITIAP